MSAFQPVSDIFNRALIANFFSSPLGVILRVVNGALLLFFLPHVVIPLLIGSKPPYLMQALVVVFAAWATFELYLRTRLIHPLRKSTLLKADLENVNLADYLDVLAAKDIIASLNLAKRQRFEALDPLHLFLTIAQGEETSWVCQKAGLDLDKLIDGAKGELTRRDKSAANQNFEKVIAQAADFARLEGASLIGRLDLLVGLFAVDPFLVKAIFDIELKLADFQNICFWFRHLKAESPKFTDFLDLSRLNRFAGLGYQWAAGYTLTLRQFATDLTATTSKGDYHLVGRDKEVATIEQILARDSRANVLLIGEPGVGKTSVVQKFALRSIAGKSLPPVRFKRVLLLEAGNLLSGVVNVGQIEERMGAILEEAQHAGNVVLYIEELQNITGAVIGTDVVDLSAILLPALQGDKLRIIAAVTPANYRRFVEVRPALDSAFTKVQIEPATANEAIRVLEEVVPKLERRHGIQITYLALKRIVELSDRYLPDRYLPGKAIDFLDELCVAAEAKGENILRPSAVEAMLTAKIGVPVATATEEERKKLLNLEKILHRRVIGQDEAIVAVANALRRARAGVRESRRPIGSFLFLGPTGVGKTETAKAVAEAFFNSERSMIRLDMSEFQHPDSVFGIIGSVKDSAQSGYLTQAIRENPYTLVLLDELEKAHPKIMELFLQILDEGRLTDANGRVANFTNSIIIATSNAGAEQIREAILAKIPMNQLKERLIDYLQKQQIFKPEFLNRFDDIVLFKPLTIDEVIKVVELMIGQLDERLKGKDISLLVTDEAKRKIAEAGYDPVFGARSLRRYLQERIESVLARKILAGEIKRGERVTIGVEDLQDLEQLQTKTGSA